MNLDTLRWTMRGRDVTCKNCHGAIYRPGPGADLCPCCCEALGQDIIAIQSALATDASRRRAEDDPMPKRRRA